MKTYKCIDCGVEGTQAVRGRNRLRCDECKKISCSTCGIKFAPTGGKHKTYCSRVCYIEGEQGVERAWLNVLREVECLVCESKVMTTASHALCDPCRATRRLDSWRRKNWSRRARLRSVPSDDYTLSEIAERDDFVCQLCSLPVDMTIPAPDRLSATVDHVVPLVAGGDDTRLNVQLAHRGCNSSKGGRTLLATAV